MEKIVILIVLKAPKIEGSTGYKSVYYYSYIGGSITQSDDYGLLR